MISPANFQTWNRPNIFRAAMWAVKYYWPGLGEQVTMALPEQVERVVHALARDLVANGGHMLSISPIDADGRPIEI